MWLHRTNLSPIAIDVGAASLRAVQLEKNGHGPTIRHWTQQFLSQAGCEKPAAAGGLALPVLERARLAGMKGFSGHTVVAALGPPDVEICTIRVPDRLLQQERAAVMRSIRHEVSKHVRIPVETAELDGWPLPPGGPADGPNLMVAVAPQQVVREFLSWVESQDLLCTRIDLAPLAIMRACGEMISDLKTSDLWGVLDIGLRSSRVYLGLGETPVYVRCLRASGDLMTRRIMNELGVDLTTAERYKRHYGIQAESGGYRPMSGPQDGVDDRRMSAILLGILTPILRGMAQDIEKSFRYVMDLYRNLSVSELILVGAGSTLDGLPEVMGKFLGIRVRRIVADRWTAEGNRHPALAENVLPGMVGCLGLGCGELEP